ncbi:DUF6303 family protein [Streptomyces sp. NPDC047981]|uniref:DUF6303 family protein n=1 Tax=Streptomyces sp. NPDC047981 TaxID=3154610 RepID=UPI003416762F
MATTITAHLTSRHDRWRLFVLLPGPVADWPEHDLGTGDVPTIRERSRALNALGYVFTDDAEWSWTEPTLRPNDPDARAYLIASIEVREAAEARG